MRARAQKLEKEFLITIITLITLIWCFRCKSYAFCPSSSNTHDEASPYTPHATHKHTHSQ